ncbi:hypothetical protein PPERSA_05131 [Pseudocohnilembus persalinus]|uniref:Tetratricopeptide repeat protein n=1 Tax=Pseudocohnilembus persalinus TaxID=266149 RepID=A0A0V0QWE2_PSEPJ|nr:hypothetical protein PPERSA_05131 [Pseudocohnilembus persalinus]|eukprot:KRX06518.1 hypothetical protein PPERSA_05131 [Pseudocohnilembus persalinus]
MEELKSNYIKRLPEQKMKQNQKQLEKLIDIKNTARIYEDKGDYWKSVDFYLQALQIEREIYGDKNDKVISTLYQIGKQYKGMNKIKTAKDYFYKAYEIQVDLHGFDTKKASLFKSLLYQPDTPPKDNIQNAHTNVDIMFKPRSYAKMEPRNRDKI